MKKVAFVVVAVGIIAAVGIGAYAHGGGREWNNVGRGGHMMGDWNSGHMMGGGYGPGHMMGDWDDDDGQWHCGGYGPGAMMGGWNRNAPGQSETAPQALTEDQVKESVQTYVDQYLPGYTIETLEQDQWRPMYYAKLKGENDAELQLFVNSFNGQVMHVFAVPTEEAPAE